MIKYFIKRPIAVLMVTLVTLMLGIVATYNISTSLMPDVPIQEIIVKLSYPNSSSRELETNVVRPLRNQLLQIDNLKNIKSQTRDGHATINLLFEYGSNIDYAFIEANEKIDGSINLLPRDLDRPIVIKASTTDLPILNLVISLKDNHSDERFLELSNFCESVIKKRIEQLPDIALADMSGQTQSEIIIIPDKDKLLSLNINNEDLINAIKNNNFEFDNLIVESGIYQYNFKFSNPLNSRGDIENIYINVKGKIFRLKDVARVEINTQFEKGLVFQNGKRAITFGIIKNVDARIDKLKSELEELIVIIRKEYPDLAFSTNQDQSYLLKVSIDNLKTSLLIGSLLAICVMIFFLKDVKSPLIIGLSIPVSLLVSILILFSLGVSINVVSLSGLILGIGMMIDNAIIVIDNINQKLNTTSSLTEACIAGTNEIITPLISSVLTTCSVFVPLIFLKGIAGSLFYDQAIAVSVGLASSLVVSIILIPVIYVQLNKSSLGFEKRLLYFEAVKFENWYEKGYNFFIKNKWIIYSFSLINIAIAFTLFQTMDYSLFPEIDQNETIVEVDWNEDINIRENQNRIQLALDGIPNIETHFTQVGEQSFLFQRSKSKSSSEATVYIKTQTSKEIAKVKQSLQEHFREQYPKSIFNFNPPETIFQQIFGNDKSRLTAKIYSKSSLDVPNEKYIKNLRMRLKNKTTTNIPLTEFIAIEIQHEKLLLYDVDYDYLINELKTSFNENLIDNLKTSQRIIPVKLKYDQTNFQKTINQLLIKNNENVQIPLKDLIKISKTLKYKSIEADKNGEYLGFDINIPRISSTDLKTIQNTFVGDEKFEVILDGDYIRQQEANNQLILIIIVAILLLYFILAAQFESLWQPLIILIEIPIDIGGSLALLWIFGETINIMSTIGIVVMCGVIINDSILKVHTINVLRKKGFAVQEAIKTTGKLRLKSILMTSLTTILALTPFLFMDGLGAELQKPLALTIIGGMATGTFISLYLIPFIYESMSTFKFYAKSN